MFVYFGALDGKNSGIALGSNKIVDVNNHFIAVESGIRCKDMTFLLAGVLWFETELMVICT